MQAVFKGLRIGNINLMMSSEYSLRKHNSSIAGHCSRTAPASRILVLFVSSVQEVVHNAWKTFQLKACSLYRKNAMLQPEEIVVQTWLEPFCVVTGQNIRKSFGYLGGGFKYFFYFHPYLGKWSDLLNMFEMGWNHQLGMFRGCRYIHHAWSLWVGHMNYLYVISSTREYDPFWLMQLKPLLWHEDDRFVKLRCFFRPCSYSFMSSDQSIPLVRHQIVQCWLLFGE